MLKHLIIILFNHFENLINNNWFNPFDTLYINFCCLPFQKAIHLPIFIFGRPKLFVAGGIIDIPTICKTGMVKINISRPGVDGNDRQSELRIVGKIIFRGKAIIVQGNKLDIFGVFDIGANTLIQQHCLIGCYKYIKVGKSFCMAHRSQLLDSNLHWLVDSDTKIVKRFSKSIICGDYCWICTNSLVLGGVNLPNHSILSAYSMLNKNFSEQEDGCIFAGIPAIAVKRHIYRFGLNKLDKMVCEYFKNHPQEDTFHLPIDLDINDLSYKDYL